MRVQTCFAHTPPLLVCQCPDGLIWARGKAAPPEDVSNSRTSRILLAGGSEVSAQTGDGPWSPESFTKQGEKESGGSSGFQLLLAA